MNLGEFYNMVYSDDHIFSDLAMKDMNAMYQQFIEMFDLTIEILLQKIRLPMADSLKWKMSWIN